ncbi:MAG: hypothetical protein A3D96_04960 [Chlamydiae bacterium RIFCSPHIGHO2_12_FULL_44_59]|nr:MAG: hypothetical protein A2796_03375 [Chlamydiae bacterium RIFCSPHIGHO2_01_FULL_44_39]OGN57141.1 MAG: hypothetical protein A3C42_02780 [Chlamydiae bacterium RIFCSPHIGHO2_02_FULL_45_9]OGN60170.1 MAG: hypothetical protein A3D96_04960 [Chlamydiae bacterium RIFCSPHIGHO2_12_FULL_44_59]OGN67177.1 MAG: hypothetical protein A2978_01080 [Chlamydiae bacterium RIFCSPLOWO2_01_FULL_44_52]OGN67767.1 MAG: hypothetical protein A3I67_05015 [Chlamydiae bacterium RIFCSPLOWO2_02_FULL_45_22]OGN71470.1 MAG: hyp
MMYTLPTMEDESQIHWKERYFELLKKVEALEAEVKRLRELLETNSKNSSKPPSQDPYSGQRDEPNPLAPQTGGSQATPAIAGLLCHLAK